MVITLNKWNIKVGERNSGANEEANDNDKENVADIDSPTTITDIQSPPFTVENIEVSYC